MICKYRILGEQIIFTSGKNLNLSAQCTASIARRIHLYVLEKSIDFPAVWIGLCSDSTGSVLYLYSLYPLRIYLHLSACECFFRAVDHNYFYMNKEPKPAALEVAVRCYFLSVSCEACSTTQL